MRIFKILLIFIFGFTLGYFIKTILGKSNPPHIINVINKPLEKYSIENLSSAKVNDGKIVITDLINENKDFSSYYFEYYFNPDPGNSYIKKTTGIINIPNDPKVLINGPGVPVILMIRGYVDPKIYKSGIGTKNSAAFFAGKGFVTIAPDFLGYASSDKEADDVFESRFQTYTLTVSLLNTLTHIHSNTSLVSGPAQAFSTLTSEDAKIFIWAHSNGGQIALTSLEILEKPIPTVLWAPVSKPFPYSILYFTDGSDDGGKLLRKKLADFETLYDTDKYSLNKYLGKITAPIEICQGTADQDVPLIWSQDFVKAAKESNIDITLQTFQGADHNMQPHWQEALNFNLEFFESHLKN